MKAQHLIAIAESDDQREPQAKGALRDSLAKALIADHGVVAAEVRPNPGGDMLMSHLSHVPGQIRLAPRLTRQYPIVIRQCGGRVCGEKRAHCFQAQKSSRGQPT
jgi:hypothetical protein